MLQLPQGVIQMKYQQIIRDLREDHDLTQQKVADFLHVAQRTYSQYELGNLPLPIECLIKLCEFYHKSADYILGLSDCGRYG